MPTETDFTSDQLRAVDAVDEWYHRWPGSGIQTFSMGGLAGTGKSFLTSYLCERYRNTQIIAPTGKAAYVQRQNGVEDACTLHSYIYSSRQHNGKTVFCKRGYIEADTVIVDEASMVGTKENNDLLSFNKRVLYVGDHGQLEPIGDNPNVLAVPDAVLETPHRQAAGSPIIKLAMAFREGREAQVLKAMEEKGWWRDEKKIVTLTRKQHASKLIGPNTQVICGFNKTRHRLNQEIRRSRGYTSEFPEAGEPVICLSNRNKYEMFNGQIVTILGVNWRGAGRTEGWIALGKGKMLPVEWIDAQFGRDTIAGFQERGALLLDWAYALTAHKCQGSGFDDVLVMEEVSNNWDVRRWRYTSVTRAKQRLVYCF
jgi:exodeoxyribonuclease-5